VSRTGIPRRPPKPAAGREEAQPRGLSLPARLALIGMAAAAMGVALWTLLRTASDDVAAASRHSELVPSETGPPVAAEWQVFRTRPGMLALEPVIRRRGNAHPRTLATWRVLRSWPGAPPRIPHGLTLEEYRDTRCATCHERGGYSPRFGSYAPVTPHPERAACLQCHTPDAALVGVSWPGSGANDGCRQCHAGIPERFVERGLDWTPAAWPRVGDRDEHGLPTIPHEVDTRGNCLACHMGAAAVAEIRTTHPERANCRQCHVVADPGVEDYVRPPAVAARGPGVVP
jgi:nitrate reductase cytochrome c-type subunit